MDALLAGLIATSIVDRAGVPLSLIGGIVWLGPAPGPVAAFVTACVAAGALGDLACYGIGARWLRGRVPDVGQGPATGAGLVARAGAYLRPVRRRTAWWLIAGKVSNPANVAITCAAGAIGFGPWRTLAWCVAASTCWIGSLGWLAYHAVGPLRAMERSTAMAFGLSWAGVLFVISRVVDRRLRRRAAIMAPCGPA